MSDYGLLSRNLTLGIKYEDSPDTYADARIPVFVVGREQLCEMFGLYGFRKPNPTNYVCDLEILEDCIQDCNYALVCFGHWADGTPSRMVTLCNAYETFEQCSNGVGLLLELDAFHMLKHPAGVIYDYEVWQLWDDDTLWHDWDLAADLYWNDECYDNWLAEISDGPHYYPTIVREHALMSKDYLSSLKAHNDSYLESLRQMREAGELERRASMRETCYYCGCFLPNKNYAVNTFDGNELKLVCKDCFNAYVAHDYGVLRYRSADTFFCECCGRAMREEYYAQTLTGTYCTECKAYHVNLGDDVSNLSEVDKVAIAVDIESADADWPRSCEHGDTYYTEGLE